MSGTLSVNDEIIKQYLRFNDAAGGEYVGLQASAVVPTSYTLSLPSAAPTTAQTLRTGSVTATDLEWITESGSIPPSISKTIYVSTYGDDIAGDGSFDTPYASLSKAIDLANSIALATNPITILISSGIYVEDNSAGPLTVTTEGISIVGDSPSGVVFLPNTPTNDLLLITKTVQIASMTFQSFAPLATGISLTAGDLTVFSNVRIFNFLTGVHCSGGADQSYGFNNCFFIANTTAMYIDSVLAECNSPTIFGDQLSAVTAANSGVVVTGAGANAVFTGGVCGLCVTAVYVTDNAIATMSSISYRLNEFEPILMYKLVEQARLQKLLVVNLAEVENWDRRKEQDLLSLMMHL